MVFDIFVVSTQGEVIDVESRHATFNTASENRGGKLIGAVEH